MVSTELSDKKPGILTAFRVLLTFLVVGIIVAIFLLVNHHTNSYDTDRAAKRTENLKKLQAENSKKSTEYAVLDPAKAIYQLPITEAISLTAKDLAVIQPHAAYPVATPIAPDAASATPAAPAATP